MSYDVYEDQVRLKKVSKTERENQYSPYRDLVYYTSSRNPELQLAMLVEKPQAPSYIVVSTHGWHMSIAKFAPMEQPQENQPYLQVQVDMRGRAFSDGQADCNGWELLDVIDAVEYVREHYREYILDPDVVYYEGGSGGGGNGFAIIGKFPDYFAAATALCGITDYALWYNNDEVGEFRDELDVWVGCSPQQNPMAYEARSGLALLENTVTPLFIAHGETDIRVPADHSRLYAEKAARLLPEGQVAYMELPGVGTRNHWGNGTEDQMRQIREASELNRQRHRQPLHIPERGKLTIGGYVFTKRFSVVLDSLDKVAVLEYDLPAGKFVLHCEAPCEYTLQLRR